MCYGDDPNDMTRQEFSEKLRQTRICVGKTTSEMMFSLRVLDSQVRRIEKAQHNFALTKAISYLNVLDHHIEVSNDYSFTVVNNQVDIVDWFDHVKFVTGNLSANALAPKIGIAQQTISKILSGKGTVTIDVFLTICNHYNAIVRFAKNERTKRP